MEISFERYQACDINNVIVSHQRFKSQNDRQEPQIRFIFDRELVMIQEPYNYSSIWWSVV